jgi:transposase-like protein
LDIPRRPSRFGSQNCLARHIHKERPENGRPWQWDKQKLEAVTLLAEGAFTDAEIARKVGISERQLYRWKQHPEFRARGQQIAKAIGAGFATMQLLVK